MKRYTFDCKLTAAFTVEATDMLAAHAFLVRLLDCCSANVGQQPNGDPLIGEVSLATDDAGNLDITYASDLENDE